MLSCVCGQLLPELRVAGQSQDHHWPQLIWQEHLPQTGGTVHNNYIQFDHLSNRRHDKLPLVLTRSNVLCDTVLTCLFTLRASVSCLPEIGLSFDVLGPNMLVFFAFLLLHPVFKLCSGKTDREF